MSYNPSGEEIGDMDVLLGANIITNITVNPGRNATVVDAVKKVQNFTMNETIKLIIPQN